jgi:hypothetical protein
MGATKTTEREQKSNMRRGRNLGVATLLSAAAILVAAFAASPAQAVLVHDFDFAGSGSAGGKLSDPAGIAINHTTGDVYVAEIGNQRISEFSAAGAFIRTWGFDVVASGKPNDNGEVFEICDTTAGNVAADCKAGKASFLSGALNTPRGIAVDNSGGPAEGDVYIQDSHNVRIQRFTADGQFVLMWGKGVNATSGGDICPRPGNPGDTCQIGAGTAELTGFTGGPFGSFGSWQSLGEYSSRIAVDEDGYVYASSGREEESRVVKFESSGTVLGYIHEKPGADPEAFTLPNVVTTDGAGHVFVSEGSIFGAQFQRFLTADFTPSGVTSGSDVSFPYYGERAKHFAVDPSNHYLFVADGLFLSPCQTIVGTAQDHIVEYSPNGELADCSPPTTPGMEFISSNFSPGIRSIAVSPTHKLYMTVNSEIRVFVTPVASPPAVDSEAAGNITTNSAKLRARVSANLSSTTYHVEYGNNPCSNLPSPCDSTAETPAGSSLLPKDENTQLNGLDPETTYYYRFIVTNGEGSDTGPDKRFSTYPEQTFDPSCPNNLSRQQTGASFLLDCRALELVSAENQGGHDVESDLVPGQTPFGGFPAASDKAMYAIHNGAVPGTGKPTNRGPDPYVATRDAANRRWNTEYVGIPADAPSAESFSSTVAGADSGLQSFVFGGPEICVPCFADGSSGMPLRHGDDSLGQGMVGSVPVADPEPSGEVRKPLSDDGSHFVFASEQKFEPEGNPDNGNVTIYDRDLEAGSTQVVSTLPGGSTMESGSAVVALDVSENGSRILIGERISTDAEGNDYFDLYMHVGNSPNTVEIVSGGSGAVYHGMTSDGSQVFFTSRENLVGDADSSVDLFRATVGAGTATVERVSAGEGEIGDTDGCDPAGNSYNTEDWNVLDGGSTDCSVVALGGGSGVAAGSGRIYFLSPEKLDGEGFLGAPNMFYADPGASPHYVSTLESNASTPFPPVGHVYQGSFGSFSPTVSSAAIDNSNGDIYVFDLNEGILEPAGYVQKFDSNGVPISSWASGGKITGIFTVGDGGLVGQPGGFPSAIGIDNNPASPNYRDLWVPDEAGTVNRYDGTTGALQDTINVGEFFSPPMAVAVNPATNGVYVVEASLFGGGSVARTYDSEGNSVAPTSFPVSGLAYGIGVSAAGKVYVANGENVTRYSLTGTPEGTLDPNPALGVVTDYEGDHIFVDEGDRVKEYDSAGVQVGPDIGFGKVANSRSLGVASGRIAVSDPSLGKVALFSGLSIPADRAYDSPLVIQSVRAAETDSSDKFQTTPSGEHAVFSTVLPLTGFDSEEKYELYRYEAAADHLDCTSCNPTSLPPATDATLASNGLSIADDGRVFFNTREALTLRDTNNQLDAYEWDSQHPNNAAGACQRPNGCMELISSGKSRSESGLLTVSADGTDAFFFTRETLAANDDNGSLMKLYTARENGGFFEVPPQPSCAASDECHGPGSQAVAPPALGTLKGTGGNTKLSKRCKKGRVRRSGKCVKRKHRHHKRKHRHHKRTAKSNRRTSR